MVGRGLRPALRIGNLEWRFSVKVTAVVPIPAPVNWPSGATALPAAKVPEAGRDHALPLWRRAHRKLVKSDFVDVVGEASLLQIDRHEADTSDRCPVERNLFGPSALHVPEWNPYFLKLGALARKQG